MSPDFPVEDINPSHLLCLLLISVLTIVKEEYTVLVVTIEWKVRQTDIRQNQTFLKSPLHTD